MSRPMVRLSRFVRFVRLVVLAIGVTVVAAPSITSAGDRQFTLEALVTDAYVAADGSMSVTERWTYRFDGGPFNFGIRSFASDVDRISDVAAADADGPLEVIPPAESESGDWEWRLRAPTSDATVTYTLTYRVNGAVRLGSDVGDLYWQFLGTDHPGVDDVRIDVRFATTLTPATPTSPDDDATVLRAWAHGPDSGTITVAPTGITATVTDVPPSTFVEVRAAIPVTAFTSAGSDSLLADILADERATSATGPTSTGHRVAWYVTPALVLAAATGTAAIWGWFGREPRATEVQGIYWREPLDDPPAVAIATLNRGTAAPAPLIAGTLADLARRGYLTIGAEVHQQLGPDTIVHHFTWRGRDLAELHPFERDLLTLVFRGRPRADTVELAAWAAAHRASAREQLDALGADVRRLYREQGYDAPTSGRGFGWLAGLSALVAAASVVTAAVTGNGVAWFGVGAALLAFTIGAKGLRNRSPAGAEAAAKAKGLKRYLTDFSQLAEAPIGHLVLWERYLVFAIAFGVSADVMRGLVGRLPRVLDDPAFAPWYVGGIAGGARFDGIDRLGVGTASVVAAAIPNSTGSGGGFSGGGGGGGGGGGAGAR